MVKNKLFKYIGLISGFVFISFSNCRQTQNELVKLNLSRKDVEDFDSFYDRFHKDSLFQISRLKFPLEGGPDRGNNDEKWTTENWTMLKTRIYDVDTSKYTVSYRKIKTSFTEKVWIKDSGYKLECRYKLVDKKWFLVALFEMNN